MDKVFGLFFALKGEGSKALFLTLIEHPSLALNIQECIGDGYFFVGEAVNPHQLDYHQLTWVSVNEQEPVMLKNLIQ